MVRRLVEQQQAGLEQQQLGQRDAHLPAAAEILTGALEVLPGEAEAEQDGARLRLDGIPLPQAELLGDVRVPPERLFVFGAFVPHVRQRVLEIPDFPLHEDQGLIDRERFFQ